MTESSAATAPDPRAVAEYVRCFGDPVAIAATCADYRAAAAIDLEHDADTGRTGQRLECPALGLWGERSFVNTDDVPAVWAEYATNLRTARVRAAHFLAEEAPAEVLDRLPPSLHGDRTAARHPGGEAADPKKGSPL